MIYQFVFIIALSFSNIVCQQNIKPLKIAIIVPKNDNNCTMRATEVAVTDINNGNIITNGINVYHFIPTFYEASDKGSEYLSVLDEIINFPQNTPVLIIDSPYRKFSKVTIDLARAVRIPIPVLSYHSGTKSLTFHTNTNMQISPTVHSKIYACPKFLQYFNWKKVSLIIDFSNNYYSDGTEEMKTIFRENNIRVVTEQYIFTDPPTNNIIKQMDQIEKQEAKVIFAMMGVAGARKVFCEAFKRGISRSNVVWVLLETLV